MHRVGEGLPDEKNRRLFKSDISNLTKMMGKRLPRFLKATESDDGSSAAW